MGNSIFHRLGNFTFLSQEGTYKNKGWIGMGDWLGTGTIANQQKEYRSFEDAREFVHSLKFNPLSFAILGLIEVLR